METQQQTQPQLYWCYNCEAETRIVNNQFACTNCRGDNLEMITNQNDPRNFNVYEQTQTQPRIRLQTFVIMEPVLTLPVFPLHFQSLLNLLMSDIEQVNQAATPQQINRLKTCQISQCAICQQNSGTGLKLDCGHSFHNQCILPWLKTKASCPNCRSKLKPEN